MSLEQGEDSTVWNWPNPSETTRCPEPREAWETTEITACCSERILGAGRDAGLLLLGPIVALYYTTYDTTLVESYGKAQSLGTI